MIIVNPTNVIGLNHIEHGRGKGFIDTFKGLPPFFQLGLIPPIEIEIHDINIVKGRPQHLFAKTIIGLFSQLGG